HPQHRGRHGREDLASLVVLDEALRAAPEVHADGVGAELDGHLGVLGAGDAANLDDEAHGGARSTRSAAPGSGARIKFSPTKTASTPTLRIRLTSSAVRMPDSATT